VFRYFLIAKSIYDHTIIFSSGQVLQKRYSYSQFTHSSSTTLFCAMWYVCTAFC